ncbi:MAG: hypothetical protein Q9174_005212, partial [Haloplaca sp. 1 TL-2023]
MPNDTHYRRRLAMVYRRLDGKATLEPLDVVSISSGQEVFDSARNRLQECSSSDSWFSRFALFFSKLDVTIAEINWILIDTIKFDNTGVRVDVKRYETDSLLTEAIYKSSLLANETNFMSMHENLLLDEGGTTHSLAGQQVLLIDTVSNKRRIAWILLLCLVLSPILGMIVGHFSHSAEVGVTHPREPRSSIIVSLISRNLKEERIMLRTALLRSRPAAYRIWRPPMAPQWLDRPTGKRSFADTKRPDSETKASIQDSDTAVLPGSHSQTAKGPTPPAPGAIPPSSDTVPTPATPSSETAIPAQSIPLVPPQPPGGKIQTAPPTSIPPVAKRQTDDIPPKGPSTSDTTSAPPPSPPPPPPPSKPRPRRFRRFLVSLILLSALGFAGGTYYSLVSDNFHDFFTEYVPFGEDAVLYFEEREFRRRFPNMTNPTNRPSTPSNTVTIPSKSGLSWKVSEEEGKGSNLEQKGRHMSALEDNRVKPAKDNAQQAPSQATRKEKVGAVEEAKKGASSPPAKSQKSEDSTQKPSSQPSTDSKSPSSSPSPAPVSSPASAPSTPPAPKTEEKPRDVNLRPPEVNEPSRIMPTARIDPLNIANADEPVIQELVKLINDIITVVNADNAQVKYQAPINQAKSGLAGVGKKIMALKQSERDAAQEKIQSTQAEFENAARELVRRLEEEMRNQTASYRDEFESERQRVSQRYQEQLESEVKREQEVSAQRLRNELLEQAVSLKKGFIDDVQDQVETERSGRLSKLSSLSSSIEELESLTSSWNKVIDSNLDTQHLLLAVEA